METGIFDTPISKDVVSCRKLSFRSRRGLDYVLILSCGLMCLLTAIPFPGGMGDFAEAKTKDPNLLSVQHNETLTAFPDSTMRGPEDRHLLAEYLCSTSARISNVLAISRLDYEYVAVIFSSETCQDYSVLILIEAQTAMVLSIVRSEIPIEEVYFVSGLCTSTLIVAIPVILVLSVCIHFSPELSLLIFSSLMVPIFVRLRGERILDNSIRGKIFGYVTAKQGASFSEIKDALGVGNGTLAYHLLVLEKQELIRSRRFGRSRRFFIEGMQAGRAPEQYLGKMETVILDRLVNDGPRTNSTLARFLGISKQRAHYNLMLLRKRGLAKAESGLWVATASHDAGLDDSLSSTK